MAMRCDQQSGRDSRSRRAAWAASWSLLAAGAGFAATPATTPAANAARPLAPAAPMQAPGRYRPDPFAGRAGRYYRLVWGVDDLNVRLTESGAMIRFTYRVLDPRRAAPLNDVRSQPALVDPQAGVSLVVPFLDNIGLLRQHPTPETGKSYWMVFSNTGRPVKRGDRVNVVIGAFRADGLVVQ